MEGSVAGPAIFEGEQPQQPAVPEQPAAPEAQPFEQQPEALKGGEQQPSPIERELQAMREQLTQLTGEQGQQPAAGGNTDLMAALEEWDPVAEFENGQPQGDPNQQAAAQQQAPQQPPQGQDGLEEARQFVREIVEEATAPEREARQLEQLEELGQRYPDIASDEVIGPMSQIIDEFVQMTGNSNLRYDPRLVERAYKMVKAEQAESAAVPAEQAASTGASLETQAGQSQAGGSSPDEDYINSVFSQQQPPSVFGI